MGIPGSVGKILSKKGIGLTGAMSLGFNAYTSISDYKTQRLEGHGKVGSSISAIGNTLMFDALGMKGMMALGALKHGPSMILDGVLKANSVARTMDQSSRAVPFNNATFVDTKQAFTMRQAGMQMAQASKYNLQQTLMGNEAASLHKL